MIAVLLPYFCCCRFVMKPEKTRSGPRLSIPGGTDNCVQIGGGASSTARGDGKGLFSTLSLKTDINSCGKTRNVVLPLSYLP